MTHKDKGKRCLLDQVSNKPDAIELRQQNINSRTTSLYHFLLLHMPQSHWKREEGNVQKKKPSVIGT